MALVEGANRAAVVQGLGHELPKLVARVRIPAAAPILVHIFANFNASSTVLLASPKIDRLVLVPGAQDNSRELII